MNLRASLRRAAMVTAIAAVPVLVIAGCAGPQTSDTTSTTLNLGVTTPPATFAAKDAAWSGDSPFLQAVYDTLLRRTPDGEIEPWLATDWSYDESLTQLTLTLRDDVTFTDGTAFTAEIAAQNLNRFRDGASPNKGYLAGVTDVTAVDDTTLVITLSAPNPTLLLALAQNPGLQESPANFDAADEATEPVGSGPYTLDTEDTVVGSSYVFEKNEDYWAPEDQHYDKIVMTVYADTTALLNAIKGNQVDAAPISDATIVDQVKASGFTLDSVQLDFYGLLLFDRAGNAEPALADVRVRQAINYALDRDALLNAIAKGSGQTTTQIFPPSSDGFVESLDSFYDYDPEKAIELLAEAGYGPGDITLAQPQSNWFPSADYALFEQYLNDVGINVTYTDAGEQFLSDALAGKYPSMLMSLKAAATPWETMTLDVLPTASWNPFRYEDAKVSEWASIIQTGSADEAQQAAQELNEYIVEQAWFAPVYRPLQSFAVDADTTVIVQQGNYFPYLWNIQPK